MRHLSRCLFCFSCCTNWYNVKEKKRKRIIWDVEDQLNLSSLKYKYKTHWMIRRVFILKSNEIFNSHYGSLNYFNILFQTFQRYSVLNAAKNNYLNFLNWIELLFYVFNSKNCMSLTCKVMFPEGNKKCFLEITPRLNSAKLLNVSCKVAYSFSFWLFSVQELRALIIWQDVLNSSQVMGLSSSKISTTMDCTLAEILVDMR